VLAACGPALSADWLRRGAGRARRLGAVLLLLLGAATAARGAIATQGLVERFRPVDSSFPALVAPAADLVVGCTFALTNREVAMRSFLPGVLFLGGIHSADELDAWLRYGRNSGFAGEVAFLLDGAHADPLLVRRLEQLAPPQQRAGLTVFRFRP
jgi:hypothetical protein